MVDRQGQQELRRMTTPRAAAVAGIVFSLLFGACVVLFRTAIPQDVVASTGWAQRGAGRVTAAAVLMPFAGIAFLWFIGVIRDRLGEYEDRFFSTVFLGSGLLFLAMTFVAVALAAAVVANAKAGYSGQLGAVHFGHALMLQITNVYAVRMAGVFMISLATIGMRTRLMPGWLVVVSYLLALTLLVVISVSLWVTLVFPTWVLAISVFLLAESRRRTSAPAAPLEPDLGKP
jgi:hypothetical protein